MPNSLAIVTGASQGIGRAAAIRHARDFSTPVLVARNRANLEQTAKAVKAAGAAALTIDADLIRREAAQPVVDQALAAFGRIDALLNIAGAVPQIDLFERTDAQWDDSLALKLHGARRLTIARSMPASRPEPAAIRSKPSSAILHQAGRKAKGSIVGMGDFLLNPIEGRESTNGKSSVN